MKDIHTNNTVQYIQSMIPNDSSWVLQLEKYAQENHVPIIDRVSMQFLVQLLHIHRPNHILEVGTAIGYSALRMHETMPNASITTIEKNQTMFEIAQHNIGHFAQNDMIHIIEDDATEALNRLRRRGKQYDFVFIDAAKGQYETYFKAIHPMLDTGAIIVSDNVLFRNYVAEKDENVPKRYRTLVRKLKAYNEFVMQHERYKSSIVPVGDGMMISLKI